MFDETVRIKHWKDYFMMHSIETIPKFEANSTHIELKVKRTYQTDWTSNEVRLNEMSPTIVCALVSK